jgi:phosphoglycolate phosphatase/AHBA synthesis associated protein
LSRVLRAVLFDMDGVLLKSEEAWAHVVAAAGERFRGSPVTLEEFQPTFGQGTEADVRFVGLGLDGDARIERLEELLAHLTAP